MRVRILFEIMELRVVVEGGETEIEIESVISKVITERVAGREVKGLVYVRFRG